MNQDVLTRVAQGGSAEAGNMLSAALANGGRPDCVCAGVILTNVAALLVTSGRLAEAKKMAERAVHTLESVRTTRPGQRAQLNALAAALLEAEDKWREAESRYAAAIRELQKAGQADTADAGTLLNGLGGIYIQEHRLDEARQALDAALAIFKRAPDADPWDRIKLLTDQESRVEPAALRPLLIDYATVRKNHRRREARSIGMRLAALGRAPENREIVDVSELLPRQEARR